MTAVSGKAGIPTGHYGIPLHEKGPAYTVISKLRCFSWKVLLLGRLTTGSTPIIDMLG
ncbi:MAG: hypothetical protein ACXV4C_07505 [Halobacteriota archaeon]